MIKISLYQLSKLVYSDVTAWDTILRSLETEKKYRVLYYQPLREAIGKLIAHPETREQITDRLRLRASAISSSCMRNSLEAFATFDELVMPRIASMSKNLFDVTARDTLVSIDDVELRGGPHIEIIDKRGKRRFLYVHVGKDWENAEKSAACELLCEVLEQVYAAPASDLWFIDLPNEEIIVGRRRSRVMNRCRIAAKLWARLTNSRAA